jgi:hypothetical protein
LAGYRIDRRNLRVDPQLLPNMGTLDLIGHAPWSLFRAMWLLTAQGAPFYDTFGRPPCPPEWGRPYLGLGLEVLPGTNR